MKVYIYVTKGPKILAHFGGKYAIRKKGESGLNGKVVASFDCNEIDHYEMEYQNDGTDDALKKIRKLTVDGDGEENEELVASNELENRDDCVLLAESCLTFNGLGKFLFKKGECGLKRFYAWRIENLKILDEPLPLSDFVASKIRENPKLTDVWPIDKAPQSWRYSVGRGAIYTKEGCFEGFRIGEDSIILSVRPEWACRILSGEKTIEIRTTKPRSL